MDRAFPLEQYLGGGEHSAVFLTRYNGRPAAVKLIRSDPHTGDLRLSRWQSAARLSHPRLIEIFHSGRDDWDGTPVLYVVMEHAEESLSQVLPNRALTTPETLELLPPILEALEYLFDRDLVHGRLKPANVMAIDDRVKLSSDGLVPASEPIERGDPPDPYAAPEQAASPLSDVWSLGMTLTEVLTRRLPAWNGAGAPVHLPELPEPFAEIARHCLQANPRDRWTIAKIAKRIGEPASVKTKPRLINWSYVAPVAALALAGVGVLGRKVEQSGMAAARPSPASTAPVPAAPVEIARQAQIPPPASDPPGVMEQVMPDIPPKAKATIHGRVAVNVSVHVDSSGKVTDARLAEPRSSRYFSDRTLKAARRWKFRAQDREQEWVLRFLFVPKNISVSAELVSPAAK